MVSKLSLALHKELVQDLAPRFDSVYEQLTRKEHSLFDDPAVHTQYPEVQFSSTTLHVGCGVARIHRSRCDFFDTLDSTKEMAGCVLLGSRDLHVPLPPCGRTWMLKSASRSVCAPEEACTVCNLVTARHNAALQRLQTEVAGSKQYVVLKVLIEAPASERAWDSFDRAELYVEGCRALPIKHACALLVDISARKVFLCESQKLLSQVQSKVSELASQLGMTSEVHSLCQQWERTPAGKLQFEWCLLYSQSMALALVRVTPDTTPEKYLRSVFKIMHKYIKTFV